MQFLSQIWQFDPYAPSLPAAMIICVCALFFLLAGLCGQMLGLGADLLHPAKQRAFHEKYALQIGESALCSLGVAALATAAAYAFLPRPLPFPADDPHLSGAPYFKFLVLPGLLTVFLLFFLIQSAIRSRARGPRLVRLGCGACASFAALLLVILGLVFFLYLPEPEIAMLLDADPAQALPGLLCSFALAADYRPAPLYLVCTGLAAAASLGRVWLIWRRNKADFGRDYYLFAMRRLSRAALFLVIAASAAGTWLFFSLAAHTAPELRQPADPLLVLPAAGLPLFCCILHIFPALAENPMRYKANAFGASILLLAAFCAQGLLLFNSYPAA
ncbi:MAG: hypothetical protein LBU06_10150 [Desulfovibrio sp.]|jgi:hypothetical protein|nr:hypothetical protein [Desulfovibrio sp.]